MNKLFYRPNREPVYLNNLYKGQACFLIGNGPSFAAVDQNQLRQPGIVTMTMNNGGNFFRSNLWLASDDPARFAESIWIDPTIMKFTPRGHAGKRYLDRKEGRYSDLTIGNCPNVIFYRHGTGFDPETWLTEKKIVWGVSSKKGGSRSSMLAALHVLWFLGFRRVYLLGADFRMSKTERYYFEEQRTKTAISNNNKLFRDLSGYFAALRPYLDKAGFVVRNCTEGSQLEAFERMDLAEAVELETVRPAESVYGMYVSTAQIVRQIKRPRRILIDLGGLALGDCICAEPAVRAVREKYGPNVDITVQTQHGVEFYGSHPAIQRAVRRVHSQFDLTLKVATRGLSLIGRAADGLGVDLADRTPRISLTAKDRAAIGRFGIDWRRKVVCLATTPGGAKAALRIWDSGKWQQIADRLRESGALIVQLGSGRPLPLKGIGHVLTGQTTIREAAAILEKAACLITVDSGLSHLAAAVETPAVVLYGPVDPANRVHESTKPVCAGTCRACWTKHVKPAECPQGHHKCMQDITAEMVWDAYQSVKTE